MAFLRTAGVILLIIIILLVYGSVFTVSEGQQALVLRLGEIVTNTTTGKPVVYFAGVHFKWPLINQVRKFDTRLQTLPVESSRILTLDQKYVLVDYYIKWHIEDLPLYYRSTGGNSLQAGTLLQQQVNDALRTAFGQRTLTDMVSGERINVIALLTQAANKTAQSLGIQVIDVRIKSIDLPKEVSERVFNRMRTKREQVATQLRSGGKAQAEAIQAKADALAAVAIASAKEQAAQLRAQGLQKAAGIYATAYSQNPEFYSFYRSLEAYRDTFNTKDDILVLKPDSQFFKYFNGISPGAINKINKTSTVSSKK